jgi:uncharacterized protein
MSTARRRLLVFAREPRAGRVKTRLIPALGVAGAAALYRRMLSDTVAQASGVDSADVELWCDFSDTQPQICTALAETHGFALHRQRGGDLGERMWHALTAAPPPDARPTLLIGSDCCGITSDYLLQAFEALAAHDGVIGPAMDGGYVLIGMNRPERRLFEAIPWSSDAVLERTRRRFDELSWRYAELPVLRDIDEPSDLLHDETERVSRAAAETTRQPS